MARSGFMVSAIVEPRIDAGFAQESLHRDSALNAQCTQRQASGHGFDGPDEFRNAGRAFTISKLGAAVGKGAAERQQRHGG